MNMFKKLMLTISVIMSFSISALAGTAITYTQNTTPATTDEMLGIDDPAGTWGINRFPLTNIRTLFHAAPTFTTSLTISGANANPTGAGMIVYDSTITGLSGGGLRWYDDDSIRVIVDLETDPSDDDYVVAYDADADGFYMKVDGGAGATAYDDIGDPDASGSIAMGAYTGTYTSGTEAWGGMIIESSDADNAGDTTLLSLKHYDDFDTNSIFLSCINDSDSGADNVAKITGLGVYIGAGTVTQTMTGDDLYVTGFLEVDGAIYADGGIVSASSTDPYLMLDVTDADDTDWTIGVNADAGASSDDNLEFRTSTTPGTEVMAFLEPDTGDLKLNGSMYILEQADAGTDVATFGQIWINTATPNELWFTNDAGTDFQLGVTGSGVLLANGTVPLTANWDVGAYTVTGLRFVSDQTTGTAPLTVASTTVVTNLNADTVDGESASGIVTAARVGGVSANLDDTDASIKWEDAADLESNGALSADTIDETKIADDGINSEHYNDASIDLIHMSTDSVDYTKTTGSFKALTPVTDSTADFAANFTGANLYGGTFVANADDGDLQLPAVAAGANFTIITLGAIQVVIEPNASDSILLDGVQLDDADSATNTSTAGDIIVFQYYSTAGWVATSNGWTDED